MKHIFIIVFAFVIVLYSGCATQKHGAIVWYEGEAMGYRGIIRVRVATEGGTITEIDVVESEEDPSVGGAAVEELISLALMYNITELDAVSGATETSEGFLAAVENAILGP